MAKIVHGYLDRIEDLENQIAEDSTEILKAIDIDRLIENPEAELQSAGMLFLENHLHEIKEGARIGENFAKKILKNVN